MIPLNCKRCGYCCTLCVKLTDKDINKIRKLGIKEENFLVIKNNKKTLKQINDYCIFLEIKEGIASCKIYNNRPKQCIEYPNKQFCDLKRHFVF